jgi:integrase
MPGNDVVTTSPARDLAPAAAAPSVAELAASAAAYADADMASATRRAYDSDWRDFSSWCDGHGAHPLPAGAATVALYLTARASTCAVTTLERRLAAIRAMHRRADLQPPDSADLRSVWAGIRRTHGRPPSQKRALLTDDLKRLVRRLPATPTGLRDKALLLVGFAGALRRSELAALELDAGAGICGPLRARFVPEGVEISIDRSKADQEGRGAVVAIPKGKTALCPVAALRAWLDAAKITSGPIFRPINRHGRMASVAMSPAAAAAVVKRACKGSRINPDDVGGHSLRAGLVTQAIMSDVSVPVIMKQTRHVSTQTLEKYVRIAERFTKNAAGRVGL